MTNERVHLAAESLISYLESLGIENKAMGELRAALAATAAPAYDQSSLLLCNTCGWNAIDPTDDQCMLCAKRTAAPEQAIHKYYPLRHVDGLPCHLCDVAQAAPASSTNGIAQPASQETALLQFREHGSDVWLGYVPLSATLKPDQYVYRPLYATPQPAEQSADAIRRKAIEDCRNCYSPDISASDWDYEMSRLIATPPVA